MRMLLPAFALAAVAATAEAAPLAPPVGGVHVLAHGTVHVGDGRVLRDASVVLSGGRVQSVVEGAFVPPEGAHVVDCAGQHVAPGFIAADTTLGLVEIGAVRATRDEAEVGDVNPHLRAWSAFNPDSELLGVAMANGVLAAVVAPRRGLVPGQSAVMLLSGWTREDMTVRGPAAMNVEWPSLAIDRSPGAKPPVDEQIRKRAERLDVLEDLMTRAAADREARRAGVAGAARAEDLTLPPLDALLDGSPVVVHADGVAQMRAAIAWARRHRVTLILSGARDAWRMADEIAAAGVPVIIGAVRALPARDSDPYDAPFAQPAILVRAGVRIAFTVLDPAHLRNLPDEAAMATAWGLRPEEALQALTSWPAAMFGVSSELGAIEPGKLGNVVVWSGPPLEITSQAERVYVRGEEIPMEDRHSRLYRKYAARPAPAVSAPAGSTR